MIRRAFFALIPVVIGFALISCTTVNDLRPRLQVNPSTKLMSVGDAVVFDISGGNGVYDFYMEQRLEVLYSKVTDAGDMERLASNRVKFTLLSGKYRELRFTAHDSSRQEAYCYITVYKK